MIFAETPVGQAQGCILAHGITAGEVRISKGTVLDHRHIEILKNAKVASILIARMGEHDLGENIAAAQIAEALAGQDVEVSEAHTGRCNLSAGADGVLSFQRSVIDGVNAVDEGITLGTLLPLETVRQGQTVATIKIIPYQQHMVVWKLERFFCVFND